MSKQVYNHHHGNILTTTSASDPSKLYYITVHSCPHCEELLWVCTCPSFTKGLAAQGRNPFQTPCKHIRGITDDPERMRKLLLMMGVPVTGPRTRYGSNS